MYRKSLKIFQNSHISCFCIFRFVAWFYKYDFWNLWQISDRHSKKINWKNVFFKMEKIWVKIKKTIFEFFPKFFDFLSRSSYNGNPIVKIWEIFGGKIEIFEKSKFEFFWKFWKFWNFLFYFLSRKSNILAYFFSRIQKSYLEHGAMRLKTR